MLDVLGEWTEYNRAGARALGDPKRSERQREFRLALGEFVGSALSCGAGLPPPKDDVLAFTLGNIVDGFRDIFPARGMMLDDILTLPPPGPDSWVVDRVARRPGVSMTPADPKCGKSWLWRCIAAAVSSDLREVLGRSIAANMPVLFVEIDGPDASVFEHYKLLGVRAAQLHHFQDYGGQRIPQRTADRFAWLAEYANDIGAGLIIVDTMLKFSPIGGNNGISDYGTMAAAMTCYQQLAAQTGAHVALLHHHAKGGDSATRSTLGSQAIDGAVDTILDLTKTADDLLAVIRSRPGELSRTGVVTEAGMKKSEGLALIATMLDDGVIQEVEDSNDARRRTIRFID